MAHRFLGPVIVRQQAFGSLFRLVFHWSLARKPFP
jgi:hypothetical protein